MPIKLLIVDDSRLIRASLGSLLQTIPGIARIGEADSVKQAVETVLREPPDLAILDMHLLGRAGSQSICTLKLAVPSLRIAVLSIYGGYSYRQKCLVLGADWCFDKATEFEKLLELVRLLARLNLYPTLDH